MFNFSSQSIRSILVLSTAAFLAVTLSAQGTPARDYSPTDATGEVLAKYRVEAEAKNYDAAIAILDAQIAKAAAGSYDLALLYQLKAQTYVQKGDFVKAIEPVEKGIQLSDAKNPTFFEERVVRDLIYFLAQVYFQEAVQSKEPAKAMAYYDKADQYMTRWATDPTKLTVDTQHFYSSLLYAKATAQNADQADLPVIKRALEQVEIGLHLAARPKDILYVMKLVCLQQLSRNEESAEMLELLIKQKPDSANYWQQLAGLYLSTEQEERAILTIERAQKNGFMNAPKDNFNLIGIYFNLGQYEKASELLEAGLKNGTIESDPKNWELLAFSYQQLQRPLKGIEALKEATKVFPKSGQMEYLIAQAYQGLDQASAALPHAEAAVAKGGLAKPHQAYLFLAYIAFELKKFDLALDAAQKAVKTPEGAKDTQAQSMLKAIEDTIKDREAKKSKM